ncbi:MAG: ABC transporter substrate-binding protein [Thermoanaerobaculia bacterium]
MTLGRRLLTAGAVCALSLSCQPAGSSRRGIPVGFYGALTGSTATFGQSGRKGASLAFDEINARGGVLGKPLSLKIEDDRGEPAEAASAVTKLISRDHVVALIGEAASSRTLAAAPISQAAEIPMITPSSTNPQVTRVGSYVFRMCFTDDFQGGMLARFAAGPLHAKTAALLVDVKNDYSVGLADAFRKTFTGSGGRIVAEQSYSEGDTDFSAQLTQIRGSAPDVLFVPGYYTEVGLIARQKLSLGVGGTLLGGDGWDSPRLAEIAGAAGDGAYFSNHYSPDDPSAETARFVAAFRGRYHEVPDSVAALSYDAARLVADAIQRAGETSGPRIREALAETRDFPGVTGQLSFDLQRNPVKAITILQLEKGRYRFVEKIEPRVIETTTPLTRREGGRATLSRREREFGERLSAGIDHQLVKPHDRAAFGKQSRGAGRRVRVRRFEHALAGDSHLHLRARETDADRPPDQLVGGHDRGSQRRALSLENTDRGNARFLNVVEHAEKILGIAKPQREPSRARVRRSLPLHRDRDPSVEEIARLRGKSEPVLPRAPGRIGLDGHVFEGDRPSVGNGPPRGGRHPEARFEPEKRRRRPGTVGIEMQAHGGGRQKEKHGRKDRRKVHEAPPKRTKSKTRCFHRP